MEDDVTAIGVTNSSGFDIESQPQGKIYEDGNPSLKESKKKMKRIND